MGARPLVSFLKNNSVNNNASEVVDEVEDKVEAEEEAEALSPEQAVRAFKEDYARKLGWTSKEEWESNGRDSNHWRDFEDFLDNSPTYFDRLRKKSREQEDRMKRNAAAAAAVVEDERRRAREDAEREAREAATAGDPDRAAAAVAKAAQAGPPPETVAWIARNPWFNEDPEAEAVMAAAVTRAAAAGKTIVEQLEAGENSVRKRFPEHFAEEDENDLPDFITRQPTKRQDEPKREVRMSESTKVAAAAQTSSNGGARVRDSRAMKEKLYKDIPSADQALYEKHFARRFQSRGATSEQARERYAKTYWGNKE